MASRRRKRDTAEAFDIELTRFASAAPLSKEIALAADGSVQSTSHAVLTQGTARRVPVPDIHTLAEIVAGIEPNEALALGRLRSDLPENVKITTRARLGRINGAARPDLIARTAANIIYAPRAAAFVLLDHDRKGMPPEIADRIAAAGGFWPALLDVLPALDGVAHLDRASTSAGLYRTDTGEKLEGSGGRHVFVPIAEGADSARFLADLHARLWLQGFGWCQTSAAAVLLDRSIIDSAVGSPERLVFEGAPILAPPLAQDAEARRPRAFTGGVLDSVAACPPLTVAEKAQLKELKAAEAQRLAPELAVARERYVERRVAELMQRPDMTEAWARKVVAEQIRKVLLSDIELEFDDPELAGSTVADVLATPAAFIGKTLADPLEGIGYGRSKAVVMHGADGWPWIRSFAHGLTRYELRDDDRDAIAPEVRALLDNDLSDKDILLPNDHIPFPFAARRLFENMARRRELFMRGGAMVELIGDTLEPVTGAKFCSRIDANRRRVRAVMIGKTGPYLAPKRCSLDRANQLIATREARDCLPPIMLVSKTAVLAEHEDALLTLGPGYHPEGGGVLVLGDAMPEPVPLDTAVVALLALLDEYKFPTLSDKSRAIAGFIGPALRSSRLVTGSALIDCVEADESQAGKNYLASLWQAVYGEAAVPVAKRDGGVGSFDEELGHAFLHASMFVLIDNVRGLLNSQYLESSITAGESVNVRLPHQGTVPVGISRISVLLTSNGIATVRDLANRMLITQILHQPAGHVFRTFGADNHDLLAEVRGRQPFYLGAIHTVVRAWHDAGKPRLPTPHSFSAWVGTLDWIVQHLFKLPPLLDRHDAAVLRASNPALNWLRAVALAVVGNAQNRAALPADLANSFLATEIRDLCEQRDIEIPGGNDHKQVGRLLAQCFAAGDEIEVDAIRVKRWIFPYKDDDGRKRDSKLYQFWRGDKPPPPKGPRLKPPEGPSAKIPPNPYNTKAAEDADEAAADAAEPKF
jgi:hypothetical protein